jgi:D-alanyl-D-alanine carboxypeptidase
MKLKTFKFSILFWLVLSVFPQCLYAFQPAGIDDEQLARITRRIRAKLEEFQLTAKFPGTMAGFVLPDGISGAVAIGLADRESKTPLRSSDRMPAGSIGKTFVAAAVLQLAQEGKLDLDEKIERWLGNEPWFRQLPNGKDITLRMLLNHSSGIPNHVDNAQFIKALFKNSERDIKYEELIGYVLGKKPLFPAGKGYHYADTNYILAGLIVEKATGNSLYDEIDRRILKPLKLAQTFPSNKLILPQTANGYFQNKPVIVNGKFTVNPQWEWAGGGFASNPEDLARWAKILYGGDFLRKDHFDEMVKGIKTGEGVDYGLGVIIIKGRWGTAYGHDGEFPGYLSDMRYFPDYKIAVAIQTNLDETPEMERLSNTCIDELAQVIIGELFSQKFSDTEKLELQKTAESWLKLIEAGKYNESWEAGSEDFKAHITKEKWQTAFQAAAGRIGSLRSRKFKELIYAKPGDELTIIDFESSFTKRPQAKETIVLKLEKDGKWRVLSYSIG